MASEPLTWAGTALWITGLMVGAWHLYQRRHRGNFYTEHAFVMGALLLLAVAPCVLLVIEFTGGVPSLGHIAIHLVGAPILLIAAWVARRRRLDPHSEGSLHTYREKSAVVIVFGQILVFGTYFYTNWSATLDELIPSFIGALFLLVIIMIVGHIVIAVFHYPIDEINEPIDARAKQIEALGSRNGSLIIAAGFWTLPFLAIGSASAPFVLNCWLAFLVLSAVVKYGSVVAYSRLGVH